MITEGQLRLISRHYAGRGREFAFLELAVRDGREAAANDR